MKKIQLKVFTYICLGINSILLIFSILLFITGKGTVGIINSTEEPTAMFLTDDLKFVKIIPLLIFLSFEIVFILNIRHFKSKSKT